MKFFTVESLGEKRRLTREGFMIVEGVPIARTGVMEYGPGEIVDEDGKDVIEPVDGKVLIQRDPDEVFRKETIASIAGKPVVEDHPEEDVTPKNWRQLACGTVMNPRRGEGDQDDLLLADIIITDAEVMSAINAGKREVSCGYDADYDELGPGLGRQHTIVINHLALVDKGRCGPRCAIGDRKKQPTEEPAMAKTRDEQPRNAFERLLRRAFKAKDESELSEVVKDAEEVVVPPTADNEVHVHLPEGGEGHDRRSRDDEPPPWFADYVRTSEARFRDLEETMGSALQKWAAQEAGEPAHQDRRRQRDDETEEERLKREADDRKKKADDEAIMGEFEMEAPPGTGDDARKAKDSAYFADSFKETVAMAEVLAPGIRAPTFDRAAKPRETFDAICQHRRQALDLAYHRPETRGVIEDVLGRGRTLDVRKLTCDQVRSLFRAAAAAQKAVNNASAAVGSLDSRRVSADAGRAGMRTPADINKAWESRRQPPAHQD